MFGISKRILIQLVMLSFVLMSCAKIQKKADLVLINGNIVTVDSNNTIVEAIAISNDTIMSLGSNSSIEDFIGDSTQVIDLKGKTAIPGFIDSHAHLIGTGQSLINLDLSKAESWDEIILLVKTATEKFNTGDWIIGRGWHQEKWEQIPNKNVEGFPNHKELSEVSPNNPVMLSHASGHAIFVNAKAMELANVTKQTKDIYGGKIIRDSNGKPIGVFMEEAEKLISIKYQEYLSGLSKTEYTDRIKLAIKLTNDECLKNGITSFHDAGTTFEEVNIIKKMVSSNEIDIRLYIMLLENYESLRDSLRKFQTVGFENNHLTVRAIKIYMDGALGSRGAWLLEPYTDQPESNGLNLTTIPQITEIAKLAAENDFQVCTHAIGDKANRTTLDIFENVFKEYPKTNDFRWRIEHAQHLNINDIPRLKQLNVIAAMQGIHCTSDAPFVVKRLGKERAESGAYAWQSIIKNGAHICNGTDSPVERISPIQNYYASVTRKTKSGEEFFGDQKMSRMQALKSYTINGAYAAFEEKLKGSLEIGKLADITVLSKDLLTISDDEILETEVNYTIIGGKVLYEKK